MISQRERIFKATDSISISLYCSADNFVLSYNETKPINDFLVDKNKKSKNHYITVIYEISSAEAYEKLKFGNTNEAFTCSARAEVDRLVYIDRKDFNGYNIIKAYSSIVRQYLEKNRNNAIKVNASMKSEYDRNAASANEKYKNKFVYFSDKVKSIKPGLFELYQLELISGLIVTTAYDFVKMINIGDVINIYGIVPDITLKDNKGSVLFGYENPKRIQLNNETLRLEMQFLLKN